VRQTLLFSATMPPEITRLAKQFQNEPVRIEVSRPATAAATITQYFTHCPSNEDTIKRAVLRSIVKEKLTDQGIVFCNRKREVDVVAKSLASHGFDAAPIHGDLPQSVRMATLDRFRSKQLKLLVASDVAARGLDIPEVSQVFNYAPPPNSDDYVHRIGRTGRAGRSGESFTIVSPGDTRLWEAVLKRIGKDVEAFVPAGMEEAVGEARGRGPAPRRDRFDRAERGGRGRRGNREPRPVEDNAATTPVTPEPVALEALAAEEAAAMAPAEVRNDATPEEGAAVAGDDHPREGRGRRRGRGRGRGRDRRTDETPRATADDAPAQERTERPERGERPEKRAERGEGRNAARNESRGESRSEPSRSKRRDADESEPRFKGMGDHVPAFLLRSVGRKQDA
jgi:superfamily II DNA/RNA helicase